jgi:hypothetical protein
VAGSQGTIRSPGPVAQCLGPYVDGQHTLRVPRPPHSALEQARAQRARR